MFQDVRFLLFKLRGHIERIIIIGLPLILLIIYNRTWWPRTTKYCLENLWNDLSEFESFDNETGVDRPIIPNFIHFIRMSPLTAEVPFIEAICILAAFKNQKPDKIFIHTDQKEFKGKYWNALLLVPGFKNTLEIVEAELPNQVFDQQVSSRWKLWHGSDLLRMNILSTYGGIFLDNDSFLIKSLDKFRHFELTLGWPYNEFLGTQVIVAHKDARFLKRWYNSYKQYYPTLWYYNAGERPTKEILWPRPELVHRVPELFGVHGLRDKLYTQNWSKWKDFYAIHLLSGHLFFYLNLPSKFNAFNIRKLNITLTDMIANVIEPSFENLI